MSDSKIISIGLTKTGTTSLHLALKALGYASQHAFKSEAVHNKVTKGNFRILDHVDAALDYPINVYWKQLYAAYPSSKFIMTIRRKDSWLECIENQWKLVNPYNPTIWTYREMLYHKGCRTFNKEKFAEAYDRRLREVNEFPHFHKDNLLILDICGGERWTKLCAFLGKPVPDIPFPHASNRKYANKITYTKAVRLL